MRSSFAAALVIGSTIALAQNTTQGPVVNLGYAQYRGENLVGLGIQSFRGIRYAQAPIGELRWRSPEPIELNNEYDVNGIIDAASAGPPCVQGFPLWASGGFGPTSPGDEDCLLVDIQVPSNPASGSLPVMVEIHGGGYTIGAAATFPGHALVAQSQGNLIFVSAQYRLGAYGFLDSAEVRDKGVPNAGLLDQRAALAWVQRNIRAFGGDPSRVTIHGASAGGGSVTAQMMMYGGEQNPPFQAAIAEYPWWQSFKNNTLLEIQYRQLLQTTDCFDIQCLRSLDAETLATASQEVYALAYNGTSTQYYGYGDFYFGPTVDGNIIQDLPSNEFKRGHFSKVPFMTNRNTYEGLSFTNQSLSTDAEVHEDLEETFPYARDSFFTRLYQLYPSSGFNSSIFQRQQIYGDYIINCPSYFAATAASDLGVPTYKMIFNAGTQLHGATLPYIFNTNNATFTLPGSTDNTTMASILKDWFISFAVTHDPNAVSYSNVSKPNWPLYNELSESGIGGSFSVIEVNYTSIGVTADRDVIAQCDFWHGQSYVARN